MTNRITQAYGDDENISPILVIAVSGLITSQIHLQAEETQPVSIADFSIQPMGNLGGGGAWDIHPKALVGTGYDSNLYGDENNEEDDAYFRGIAGMTTRWYASESMTFTGDGEFETKQFFDSKNNGADFNGGTISLGLQSAGLVDTFSANASWKRADDPTVSTGETLATSTLSGGLDYRYEGILDTYSLGAGVATALTTSKAAAPSTPKSVTTPKPSSMAPTAKPSTKANTGMYAVRLKHRTTIPIAPTATLGTRLYSRCYDAAGRAHKPCR